MDNAIMRVFDSFDHAEQARAALLANGFARESVKLSIVGDEAGPVSGNFTVGSGPPESPDHTYDRNYANPVQRSHCMITVDAGGGALLAQAAGILARFGGRDPDPAAAAARAGGQHT